MSCRVFPGGSAVKNLPAKAGDMDSNSNLGRSCMLWEQLSPGATTIESVLLSPHAATTEAQKLMLCNKSHCNEKPARCTWRVAPTHHKERKASIARKHSSQEVIWFKNHAFHFISKSSIVWNCADMTIIYIFYLVLAYMSVFNYNFCLWN